MWRFVQERRFLIFMQKRLSIESIVVALVQFIMLGLVFVGVLSRYLLHFSISFTEELVCALFILLSTMGGALASKDNSHFTLDLITGMMKPKMQNRFLIFNTFLTFVAAAILFISGITMVINQIKIGSLSIALKIPAWIYGTFVPLGLFFILYRSIEVIIHTIKRDNSLGSREEDGEK